MPKIVQYNLPPGGTVVQVADEELKSLEIESTEAKDFLLISTVNGDESVRLVKSEHFAYGDTLTNEAKMVITPQPNQVLFDTPAASGRDFVFRPNAAEILRITAEKAIKPSGPFLYHQGTGVDTATTQAVYLPSGSSGAKIIVDFANGNVGDITLTAAVTSIDFYNVPADGTCATVTARITQDSSNRTIDYSDSAVSCFSGAGSGPVTGEIKFSGGVHHTQSAGSGEVDIISFTSIPTGSTFNIYAAVIGQDFA